MLFVKYGWNVYMYIYEDVIIIGGKWDFEIIYFIVYMW